MLVVKHAVAVTLEVLVGHLVAELLAHALVLRRLFQPARAISAGAPQPLADGLYNLLVVVEPYLHSKRLLSSVVQSPARRACRAGR